MNELNRTAPRAKPKPTIEDMLRSTLHGSESVMWTCHGECREAAQAILRRFNVTLKDRSYLDA